MSDELARIHQELHELFERMDARFDRIEKMLDECSAVLSIVIGRSKALKEQTAPGGPTLLPISPERAHETGQLYLALSEQLEASGALAQAALERQRAESWSGYAITRTQAASAYPSELTSGNCEKLCVDCRWCRGNIYSGPDQHAECTHPTAWRPPTSHVVTGELMPGGWYLCGTARMPSERIMCGANGRFWEAKHDTSGENRITKNVGFE